MHLPALRSHQPGQHIAQRRLPAMADVQRAGGIGRHELQHDLAATGRLPAEVLALCQHLVHHALACRRGEPEIDEARAGDVGLFDEGSGTRQGHQGSHQRLGHRTGRLFKRPGQLHGQIGCKITMFGLARPLQRGHDGSGLFGIHADGHHGLCQQLAQFVCLCGKHPGILEPAAPFGRIGKAG